MDFSILVLHHWIHSCGTTCMLCVCSFQVCVYWSMIVCILLMWFFFEALWFWLWYSICALVFSMVVMNLVIDFWFHVSYSHIGRWDGPWQNGSGNHIFDFVESLAQRFWSTSYSLSCFCFGKLGKGTKEVVPVLFCPSISRVCTRSILQGVEFLVQVRIASSI